MRNLKVRPSVARSAAASKGPVVARSAMSGESQEFWTAKDLGIVTWSKVESEELTTTRVLRNIGVAEPDQSLFQVPSDYTVINQPLPMEMITSVAPTRSPRGNGFGKVIAVPAPSP